MCSFEPPTKHRPDNAEELQSLEQRVLGCSRALGQILGRKVAGFSALGYVGGLT